MLSVILQTREGPVCILLRSSRKDYYVIKLTHFLQELFSIRTYIEEPSVIDLFIM